MGRPQSLCSKEWEDIINFNELGRTRNEEVVAYFKVLFQHLSEYTGKP